MTVEQFRRSWMVVAWMERVFAAARRRAIARPGLLWAPRGLHPQSEGGTTATDYRQIQRDNFSAQVDARRYSETTQHSRTQQEFLLRTFATVCGERWRSTDCLSILDCGMGTGPTLDMLITNRPWGAFNISGFDLTPAMVHACRTRFARLDRPNVHVQRLAVGDVTDPTNYHGTYDVVYTMLVLQQLPAADQRRALLCMVAATKSSGSAIVFDRERHSRYGVMMAAKKTATRLGLPVVPPHFLAARYPCLARLARYCRAHLRCSTVIHRDARRELFALVVSHATNE